MRTILELGCGTGNDAARLAGEGYSVTAVDLSDRPFKITSSEGDLVAETLIIATGATAKWLGIPSEQKFVNYGVSACATCDGALFKGRELIVATVRRFVQNEVIPVASALEHRNEYPHALVEQMRRIGLFGLNIPEEYGGGGGKFFDSILAVEELSRVDASAGVLVDVQNTLVNNALMRWGTVEQRKRY